MQSNSCSVHSKATKSAAHQYCSPIIVLVVVAVYIVIWTHNTHFRVTMGWCAAAIG